MDSITIPTVSESTEDLDRTSTDAHGAFMVSSNVEVLRANIEAMHAKRAEYFATLGIKGRAITLPPGAIITGVAAYHGVGAGMTGVVTWDGPDYEQVFGPNGTKVENPNADERTLQIAFPFITTPKGTNPFIRLPYALAMEDGFILGGYWNEAPEWTSADSLHAMETKLAAWEERADRD